MPYDRDNCMIEGCVDRPSIFDRAGGYCRTHWDEAEAARRAENHRATEEAGGPWPQTCPRRMGEIGPWDRGEDADTWDIREQMHQGLQARHCSFCGSLHPDDFMRLVKEGWRVGATDKNYKAYLGSPEPGGGSMETKFYFQHLSDEQKREFVDLHNAGRIAFTSGGGFYRLPFFMVRA